MSLEKTPDDGNAEQKKLTEFPDSHSLAADRIGSKGEISFFSFQEVKGNKKTDN